MANDIEEIFLQAAEIVKKLPKNLQETAFNRAVDELRRKNAPAAEHRATSRKTKSTSLEDELSEKIDRTKYPDIGATSRVADQALKVLQLAADDYQVDGLTAAEITKILTLKFRLPVSSNAVSMALDRETGTVNTTKNSEGKKIFRLMAPGEDYLRKLRAGEAAAPKRGNSPGRRKQKAPPKQRIEPANSEATEAPSARSTASAQKKKKNSSRVGPMGAINQLISERFFDTPRQISTIQQALKDQKGLVYPVQFLSPTLIRLLRNNSLSRNRNADGQYEYFKK